MKEHPRKREGNIMKNLIMHNIGLKLLSVVLALLLWLTVMNVEDPAVSKTITDVPVTIVNDDVIKSRGYGYTIESGEKVDIKVKGRRSVVDNIVAEDFVATADFNSVSTMKMVPIEVSCVDEHAEDLEWVAKMDSMAIILEEELESSRNVRIDRIGEVKEGYYLYDYSTETSLVKIKGAQSQVESVKEIVAEVNIEGMKDSSSPEVALYAVNASGEKIDSMKITLEPETVKVNLTIYPVKTVALNVRAVGVPEDYYYLGEIEFAPKEIQVTAEESVLNQLETLDIAVNINGASEDVEKQVNLEEYVEKYYHQHNLKIVDQTATMGIKIPVIPMSSHIFYVKGEDINLKGADTEKYKYTVSTDIRSRVVVRGKAEEMTNIEISDFGLYVDVTGLIPAESYMLDVVYDYDGTLMLETGQVWLKIEEVVPDANVTTEPEVIQ